MRPCQAIIALHHVRATLRPLNAAIPIRLVEPPLRQAVELSRRLNIYAYDAYVLACAIIHRAPILSLDNAMKDRARELKIEILEIETA